ncbi:hypothetical protein VR41_03245 [Streptomyces sp. NRRL B-1568]|nr:hypothetical protein VR41_03245 [Streptomyces sp. NRRL B-1568]
MEAALGEEEAEADAADSQVLVLDCPEEHSSYVFTVRWHPPPQEGLLRAVLTAHPDCPSAAGLTGKLEAEVHPLYLDGRRWVPALESLSAAACNAVLGRLGQVIDALGETTAELQVLREFPLAVNLTVRIHDASGQPFAAFRMSGRTAAAPADTAREVRWDEPCARLSKPPRHRIRLMLALPPAP